MQAKFVTKCHRITEQIDESTIDIDYQFMTEEDMKKENFSACLLCILYACPHVCLRQYIAAIKDNCKDDPTLTRRFSIRLFLCPNMSESRTSKYGGGVMYWVERSISGKKRTVLVTNRMPAGRNTRRNTLKKMMEYEEQEGLEDLDLSLPGRDAVGPCPELIVSFWLQMFYF